jgi:IS30 family transposase
MPGAPLSLPEREEISVALIEDRKASWASIGRRIGRPPTTVMREVERNGGRHKYRPAIADKRARRCRRRSRQRVLARPGWLRERVTSELCSGRSPEAIWADLRAEGAAQLVSIETMYSSIYAGTLDVKATDCLRSRRPRRRRRQARHASGRPALPNISVRPASVGDRSEPGHWEADQIMGARNRSSMLWLTERQTRYSIPVTMPNGYAAPDTLAGLVEGLDQIPSHLLKSVT